MNFFGAGLEASFHWRIHDVRVQIRIFDFIVVCVTTGLLVIFGQSIHFTRIDDVVVELVNVSSGGLHFGEIQSGRSGRVLHDGLQKSVVWDGISDFEECVVETVFV